MAVSILTRSVPYPPFLFTSDSLHSQPIIYIAGFKKVISMKRIVLYVADKCPHCKDAQRYLDSKGIKYRLTNAKMQRGRKELQAMGARSIPVLKIGDQVMVGWNQKNFDKMYNA